ncbi:MAG TPA: antibiotic biosynthesis monooxygenase, partial [Candidatus Dormibacteraeota bacterium]
GFAMYLRTIRLAGSPENLEGVITRFDEISAPVRGLPGCAAVMLAADVGAGKAIIFSYWESEGALNASEEPGAGVRARTAAEHGIEVVDVERYEVSYLERRKPPTAGTFVRLVSTTRPPEQLDALLSAVQGRVLPIIVNQKGFRSAVNAVNRQNGKVIGGSSWDTAADREASNAATATVREELMAAAGSAPEVENYDVVFADIRVTAGSGA